MGHKKRKEGKERGEEGRKEGRRRERRKKKGRKEGERKEGKRDGGRKETVIRVRKGSGLSPLCDKKDQEQAFTLFFPERSTMTPLSPNKY